LQLIADVFLVAQPPLFLGFLSTCLETKKEIIIRIDNPDNVSSSSLRKLEGIFLSPDKRGGNIDFWS
jgi:hypothetical protein